MEETTVGRHQHQDSWTITQEPDSLTPEEQHYEVYTCNECGVKFVHRKDGPVPEEG